MKSLLILFTCLTTLLASANPGSFDMPTKQGESSRTAYLAYVKPDSVEAVKKTLTPNENQIKVLAKHGITNISFWIDKADKTSIFHTALV